MSDIDDQTDALRARRYEAASIILAKSGEPDASYAALIVAAIIREFRIEHVGKVQQYPIERLFYTEMKELAATCAVPEGVSVENPENIQRMTAGWMVSMGRTSYIEPRKPPLPRRLGKTRRQDQVMDAIIAARAIAYNIDPNVQGLEASGLIAPEVRQQLRAAAFRP